MIWLFDALNVERDAPKFSNYLGSFLDSFIATGPAGEHQYLIHEPLGMSMETLRQLIPGRKLPEIFLKLFLTHLLQALDFLHKDAQMIAGMKHCT